VYLSPLYFANINNLIAMGSTLESTTIPNIFAQGDPQINGQYQNYNPNQQQQQQYPTSNGGSPYAANGMLTPIIQWLWTEGPAQECALIALYSLLLWFVYKLMAWRINKWRTSRSASTNAAAVPNPTGFGQGQVQFKPKKN
jgi:hypothetical protein